VFDMPDEKILEQYSLQTYRYDMLIARLEPENSIEIILDGVAAADSRPFIVIGKHKTKYGEYLKQKYKSFSHIRFQGGIYDINILNNLRYFSNLYFHGHTVGGTNPSLLEAMGSSALISAHKNIFNESILNEDAFYFENAEQVKQLVEIIDKKSYSDMIDSNVCKINELYNWDKIIEQYEQHFFAISKSKVNKAVPYEF
jgi:glycosyltransferase involved in cell wall biosynthesis